jgi:hypothetical protein
VEATFTSQLAIGSLRGRGGEGGEGGEGRGGIPSPTMPSNARDTDIESFIFMLSLLGSTNSNVVTKERREGSYSSNKGMSEDMRMDVNRPEPCHSLPASKSILFASPASHLTLSLTKHAYVPSVLAQLIQGDGERRDVQTQNDILHRSHGNADRWGWESGARWMDIVFPLSGVMMLVPYFGP